jgi:hypothetical protein
VLLVATCSSAAHVSPSLNARTQIESEATEDYIEYLISVGQLQEAAHKLVDLVNDQKYVSPKGTSHHQLWNKLCDLLSKHPKEITGVKTEAIIREGASDPLIQPRHFRKQ